MKLPSTYLDSEKFYLGKPCIYGHIHIGMNTLRHVKNTTCFECQAIRIKNWMQSEDGRKSVRATKMRRKAKARIRDAEYRRENAQRLKEYNRKYIAKNKDWHLAYFRSINNRRKAIALNARPSWANEQKMIEFYKRSVLLTSQSGVQHHVDHIVPLISKIVCGLHVENNFQILTALDNIRKGNRHWPDCP